VSGKNQYPLDFNWQSTNPATGFLPLNNNTQAQGSKPSGVLGGAMASTNTIYTQIVDVSRMDNMGITLTWTGTPTGTIQVMVGSKGNDFYALTFSPVLTQPAGSAGGYYVNLTQLGAKYLMLQYANTSGSGTLTSYVQFKDLN
jgi:hypothetical protein